MKMKSVLLALYPVAFVATGVLALAGCESPKYPTYAIDRTSYAERFDACMKALPAGPSHLTASGNDWAEVVETCNVTARQQAKVCISNCTAGEW